MKYSREGRVAENFDLLLIGFFTGALIAALSAFLYLNNEFKHYVASQQEGDLVEYEQLSWNAYSSELPATGMWALSNYLKEVDDVYNLRPAKDREYYYSVFKGHARLVRLAQKIHDTNSAAIHMTQALDSLKMWSSEKPTNSEAVIQSIEKIDQLESGGK